MTLTFLTPASGPHLTLPSPPPSSCASVQPSFFLKLAYFCGNAIIIGVLYGVKTSALYVPLPPGAPASTPRTTDSLVEGWMWLCILLSWVAYLAAQGSSPGYVELGNSESDGCTRRSLRAAAALTSPCPLVPSLFAAPPPSAVTGAARSSTTPTTDPDSLKLTVGDAANPGVAVAVAGAGAGAFHDDDSDAAAGGDSQSLRPGRSNNAVTAYERRTAGGIVDADPDYPPSFDADEDPEAALQRAVELAKGGHRDCKWCHVQQPARAHHCKQCNKCVRTFDHHCNIIGTCIGERNRCRFWWFLFLESLALAYGIGLLNTSFVWQRTSGEWVSANALPLFTVIVLWILQLTVFPLFCFHSWLAMTNGTTFEIMTGSRRLWYLAGTDARECDLPYSKGCCGNLRLFCCVLDGFRLCCKRSKVADAQWKPTEWEYPGVIDRYSEDVCKNPWVNKYWSCC